MENRLDKINIREVFQLLVRRFGVLQKEGSQSWNVTVIQSHIIYELYKRPNISLNDLSVILAMDSSPLSRQIQILVEKELINRLVDPVDRRYVVLSLTSKGEELYYEISKHMDVYIQNILRLIPEENLEEVLRSLYVLSEAMSKSSNCCSPPM